MVFSLNYENRIAFQQSFTNFTLDLKPAEVFKDTAAIVGGIPQSYTYGELSREVELVNKAFFEIYLEGDGNGGLFSFPIPTVQIVDDYIFEDNEVNNLFWELTCKFGAPYFSNFIGTGMDPKSTRSMCCRLNLSAEEAEQPHGLWAIGSKTGSLAVATVNLNRVALKASEAFTLSSENKAPDRTKLFKKILLETMGKAREQLKYRRNRIEEGRVKHKLLPIFSEYIGTEKTFFLTVGICGMHEACVNLLGKPIGECEDFVISILEMMKKEIRRWKEEDGILYNFEQTPAETASYALAKKDREHFPDGFVSTGDNNVPFLTNSTHEPMYDGRTLQQRLEWADKTDKYYTGGTILHIWLNEKPNVASAKALVKKVLKYNIPYFTLTPSITQCSDCGKISYGIRTKCPHCKGENVESLTRVVGYYAPMSRFNIGQYEQHMAKKYFDREINDGEEN
jgi:ribonucleoside-triphosphate reductase (formate)